MTLAWSKVSFRSGANRGVHVTRSSHGQEVKKTLDKGNTKVIAECL